MTISKGCPGARVSLGEEGDRIVEVIGFAAAVRLIRALPQAGSRPWRRCLYVPVRVTADHSISKVIGLPLARRLSAAFGGMIVQPANENRVARASIELAVMYRRRLGLSASTIANVLDLQVSKVRAIIRRNDAVAVPRTDMTRVRRKDVIAAQQANLNRIRFANSIAAVMSVLCEHAIDIGWIRENPAKGVRKVATPKEKQKPHIPWTDKAVARMRAEARPLPRLIFELGVGSVQRPGDLVDFCWGDYDGESLALRQNKTDKPLKLPCTPQLKAALDEARAELEVVFI